MKKLLSLFAVLIILLTACGGNDAEKALSSLQKFKDTLNDESTTVALTYKSEALESTLTFNVANEYYKETYKGTANDKFNYSFEVEKGKVKNIDSDISTKKEVQKTADDFFKDLDVNEEVSIDKEIKALEDLSGKSDDEIAKVLTKEDDYYVYNDKKLHFKIKTDGTELIKSSTKDFKVTTTVVLKK